MPTYEYECPEGHAFEKFQKMTDKPPRQVPDLRQAGGRGRSRAGPGWCSGAAASTSPTTARTARDPGSPRPRSRRREAREHGAPPRRKPSPTPSTAPRREAQAREEGRQRVSDALRAELDAGRRARSAPTGSSSSSSARATPATATSPPTSPWCSPAASAAIPAQMAERVVARAAASRRRGRPDRDRRPRLHQLLAGRRPARRGASRRILGRGPAYGRSAAGAGAQGQRRVRVGQSDRARCTSGMAAAPRWATRIAALLEWTGHAVTREFYINDAGVQIDQLGAEPLGPRPAGGRARARRSPRAATTASTCVENARHVLAAKEGRAFADLPEAEGDAPLPARSALPDPARGAGPRPRRLRRPLRRDDARSRRSTTAARSQRALDAARRARADLRSRTARSGSGPPSSATTRTACCGSATARFTYLVPDIAYHIDKHERGFDRAIDVWGADHHGYIPRMRAVLRALGYADDFFDVELVQLVKVVRGGEEVKMSKRVRRVRHAARPVRGGRRGRRALLLPACGRARARSTSTSTSPSGRPTRTRSSTCRWRTPG